MSAKRSRLPTCVTFSTRRTTPMAILSEERLREKIAQGRALLALRDVPEPTEAEAWRKWAADVQTSYCEFDEKLPTLLDALDEALKERERLRERVKAFRASLDCRNRKWNANKGTCLEVGAKGPYKCEQCELLEDDDRLA